MKRYRGIGVMSGTSLDAIDLCYAEFREEAEGGWQHTILKTATAPWPEDWQCRLRELDKSDAEEFAMADVQVARVYGRVIREFIEEATARPQFVACHGQTIFHQPGLGFTAQIGDGETIAALLKLPVITNFRRKDMAIGGQGAPLVPFGEKVLFPDVRLFLNLGGFANLTIGETAFDICACNMALNWLSMQLKAPRAFDEDGKAARSGILREDLLNELNRLPYYSQKPPKSLGKEWFESEVLPLIGQDRFTVEDRLTTYCVHIAVQISKALELAGESDGKIMVTGGGAHNAFLCEQIARAIGKQNLRIITDLPSALINHKEALIFGFLGLNTLLGRPNTLASVTGSSHDLIGGSIHLPPTGGDFQIISSLS